MIEDMMQRGNDMSVDVKHFVLTPDGDIREFSAEAAARVASGQSALPEFADSRLRYLQIALDQSKGDEIRVQTGIACLQFDAEGHFSGAAAPAGEDEQVDSFEYDACIQWALRGTGSSELVYH
ncbi:MAG: hypothetical protein RLN67_11180 [Algiphilus sp.]|uniref:hypothetical protein n=2 Tax=Algiphilus sp. TaxID=1872431 RepID=UPI0025C40581|nr:hypothetical protein [Algiphilus sp.]MCI5103832.1 hypothetical protein [Algiphilus sp.]